MYQYMITYIYICPRSRYGAKSSVSCLLSRLRREDEIHGLRLKVELRLFQGLAQVHQAPGAVVVEHTQVRITQRVPQNLLEALALLKESDENVGHVARKSFEKSTAKAKNSQKALKSQ